MTRLHGSSLSGSAAAPVAPDAGCGGAGEEDAFAQEGAAVEQPVTGNGRQ